MSLKIEIKGIENLVKALQHIKGLQEPLAEAIELFLNKVVEEAQSIVPVRTGTLQRSIRWQGGNGEYSVGSPVNYASYVEFGTSRMAPRPYLTPALEHNIPLLKQDLLEKIKDWLRRRGE